MTAPGEHGGEPACDDSHNQFLPLLRLLGLRDEDDLNYVTEEDVRAALPLGSTLQQRVDYIRMLKTKHTDRTRSSTSHARDLLNYLNDLGGSALSVDDKLCHAEKWFNARWQNTNSVEKTYEDLHSLSADTKESVEDMYSRILNLKQNAKFLDHVIPDTTLRKSFLNALKPTLRAALLQVHPSPSTSLQTLVDWCIDYEQALQLTIPSATRTSTASSQLCRQYISGHCRYGASCKFLHTGSPRSDGPGSKTATAVVATGQAGVDGVSIQGPMKRLEDPELIRLCKEQGVCMAFTARGSCKLGQQCQYKHDALVRILAGSPVSRSVTVLNSKSLHGFYVEPDTGASHSIITERLAQHLLSSVPGASLHPNDARFDTACSLGSLSSTHRLSVALPVTNGMETFILHWSPSVICNSNLLHSDGLLGMDCMDFDKDALWLRLGDTRLRAAQFFTPPVTPRYDETGYAEDHRLSARRPSTDHTPPHESCQLVRKASPAPYSFDHLGLVSPTFPPAPDGYSVDAVVYENEWLRIYLLKCHGLDDRYEFCVDYSDQLLDTALSHPPRPVQKIHYKLTTAPKEERKEAHDRLIKLIHTKKLVPTAPCDKNTYASNWYPVRGRKKVRPVVPELRANAVLQMVCKRWPIVDCQSKISRLINKFRCYPYYKTLDVADAYRAIRLGDNAQKMCQVYLDSKSFTFAYMCDGTAINPPVLEHIVKFILRRISEDDDFKDIAISYMDDIIQLSGKGDLAAGTELIIKTFAKYNMKLTLSSSPDDPVLGYDVVCGGTKLGYPPKKYNLSINFNITGDLSYGSALSLLAL
ncbi:hypothetical protein FOZ63_013022 [Perkinsus olseni]|uniref:C3H1-type domain-containing protein n=1 Tax=Perkinsus olseni TaxID=32597 RepID=A0A7J6Q118_PEROL|nr:hypothetical protein FOZ63_013022 [Perkinsus olseni]